MKVSISTLGCKVNQYETQALERELLRRGHSLVDFSQTADAYIERATYEIAPTNRVRVVTSDLAEQYIILGNGALRVSANEFRRELGAAALEMNEIIDKYTHKSK